MDKRWTVGLNEDYRQRLAQGKTGSRCTHAGNKPIHQDARLLRFQHPEKAIPYSRWQFRHRAAVQFDVHLCGMLRIPHKC